MLGISKKKWEQRWQAYTRQAVRGVCLGRGTGDCWALAAGWASLVSGQALRLMPLTEKGAEEYLRAAGGMTQAVQRELSPLGYLPADTSGLGEGFGIIVFSTEGAVFDKGVGVVVGARIATRSDGSAAVVYRRRRGSEGEVWNHQNIKKWD